MPVHRYSSIIFSVSVLTVPLINAFVIFNLVIVAIQEFLEKQASIQKNPYVNRPLLL